MSDMLHDLLRRRTALVQQFIADLEALDIEIGVAQRHNVQTQAAAMLTAPYDHLVEADAQQREESRTLFAAFREHLRAVQRELREVHTDLAAHQRREDDGVAVLRTELAALAADLAALAAELRAILPPLREPGP